MRKTDFSIELDEKTKARFWSKVNVLTDAECWDWKEYKNYAGYGRIFIKGKLLFAHAVSFCTVHKKIEKNLVIDHICMNKSCVNPNHLRAVTFRINLIENSNTVSAKNYRKTHCKSGHEFTKENTMLTKSHGGIARKCKICHEISRVKYRSKIKKERSAL